MKANLLFEMTNMEEEQVQGRPRAVLSRYMSLRAEEVRSVRQNVFRIGISISHCKFMFIDVGSKKNCYLLAALRGGSIAIY